MSFFRPASPPPPRSPSPEVVLKPLPPPRRTPRLSLQSSDERPKTERPQRSLASMRSCGDLRHPATPKSASRSVVSAPPTPRTVVPSSPSGSSFRRTHKRSTLSYAVPYRSPPASPTLSSPPPPVPPIPEFVLSPTDKKAVLHPATPTRHHIYLPEWEQFAVVPDLAAPPRKKRTSMSRRPVAAPPAAMTCSTFLALHNQTQRPNHVVAL
ncbi:hypothetical protein K438DRAFT_1826450 [Mycena galopus ATCC 62051]|nr:hypothetical protein K438DRAFT_1826450 [Mycena galopus ATCC 62051]